MILTLTIPIGRVTLDKNKKISDDCLRTLEEVQKQYRQYLETSKIYELPLGVEEVAEQQHPPSHEHPLTTNTFRVK